MAKEQLAVAELIMNIMLGRTDVPARVDFFPQKEKFPYDKPYEQPFPRATPESQGISSDYLLELIRELDGSEYTDMHHFMVLRNGNVICECNFAPYRKEIWHVTHSMCKSITSMAIGMLIFEGQLSLDENIYRIFENKMNPLVKLFRPTVTVENLLTMTSGVLFNESGIVSGNNWLGSYLNASVAGRQGEEFQYNSMNTYVLSAIVTERTGMTLEEYLRPRLFEPLGITRYFWETCPMGITKGGWGLFLCAEDMAKLGQLYLQKGMWNGMQLVPEEWVDISTRKQVESVEGTFGYGYQIWMEQRPESFEFNGMLGQNVIVYPDLNMVIVTNAGNNELFQNCVMLSIVRKYFPEEYQPGEKLPENPYSQARLNRLTGEIEEGKKLLHPISRGGWKRGKRMARNEIRDDSLQMRMLNGRCYIMKPQSIGLFPLFIQVFHNNMTEGIEKIGFTYGKGEFAARFFEAGEWHDVPVGFGKAKETWLTIHEESYLIGTKGEFTTDENGCLVLKLEMAFIEESARRKVNLFFHGDELEARWLETPGKGMIIEGLESVTKEMIKNHPLMFNFKDLEITEIIHRLMQQTIEPISYGALERNRSNMEESNCIVEMSVEDDDLDKETVTIPIM